MALLDRLQRMEQDVVKRLRELEPLAKEYEELKKVAARLGLRSDDGATAQSPARRSPRAEAKTSTGTSAGAKRSRSASGSAPKRSGSRRRRNAVAPGSRQQDVLRLVNERPGISVPELGKELDVDPTGLYQIVRRLEGRGQVRKEGRQLRPVAGADAASAGQGQRTEPAE